MQNTKTLCVDIGTSWIKFQIMKRIKENLEICFSSKTMSVVDQLDGSMRAIRIFVDIAEEIRSKIENYAKKYRIERIGLTGIREGMVLLDKKLNPIRVTGNLILESDLSEEKEILYSRIISGQNFEKSIISLQGYLAYLLTNQLAITKSELNGMGINNNLLKNEMSDSSNDFRNAKVVPIGAPFACLNKHHASRVFLGGTDEQAGLYGAGLGGTTHIALSTGTFWSLASSVKRCSVTNKCIRYIPAEFPYMSASSLIGFKWGEYLEAISRGNFPNLPSKLPFWAKGIFISKLKSRNINKEEAIDAISKDILQGLRLLKTEGLLSESKKIVLYGGGLKMPILIDKIMKKVGHPWEKLPGDASAIGSYLANEHYEESIKSRECSNGTLKTESL